MGKGMGRGVKPLPAGNRQDTNNKREKEALAPKIPAVLKMQNSAQSALLHITSYNILCWQQFPILLRQNIKQPLQDQHRVPVGRELILVLDRLPVCFYDQIITAKSAGQDHQRALRQVKIGHQRIGYIKLVRRMDKIIRPAFAGL